MRRASLKALHLGVVLFALSLSGPALDRSPGTLAGPVGAAGLPAEPAPSSEPPPPVPAASPPPGLSAGAASDPNARAALAALAADDLKRGTESLFRKQGARRFEEAAAALTAAIDRLSPYLDSIDAEARRTLARALDYRAQCRLLQGREREAEADFALLVAADPSYAPDAAITSRKILERFRRIQSSRIAYVTVQVDPQEAEIIWNGRRMGSAPQPEMPVLAGPFVLKAQRACFGPVSIEGSLARGERRVVPVHLDPIARGIRFETAPAGFDVELDGTASGRTTSLESAAGAGAGAPEIGALEIACVPAGEHSYLLKKDCYEPTRGSVTIDIDFVDPSPLLLPRLAPAQRVVNLSVESDVPGARVLVDGSGVGTIPLRNSTVCPGRKKVEVRTDGRLLWSAEVDLQKSGPALILARSRPLLRTVVLEGPAPGATARGRTAVASRIRERVRRLDGFNQVEGTASEEDLDLLRSLERAEGSTPPGRIEFGADLLFIAEGQETDRGSLVRMRLIPAMAGPTETVVCQADDAGCVEGFLAGLEAPWPRSAPDAGLTAVAGPGGSDLLVFGARGPAKAAGVREGDRIVGAQGQPVETEAALRSAIDRALGEAPEGTVTLTLRRVGERVEVPVKIHRTPIVAPPGSYPVPAARILATAQFEVSVLPPGEARNAALLNLATVLIGHADYRRALDLSLERTGWAEAVSGAAGPGVARFLAGRCYEALDDHVRALSAFRKAAEDPEATFWEPEGLPVAPLARLKILASSFDP